MTPRNDALAPAKGERGEAATGATDSHYDNTPRGAAEFPPVVVAPCKRMPPTRRREERWLAGAEALTTARLPPTSGFKSRSRASSPIGNLMRWVDKQAGRQVSPNDVLVHNADLAELLDEQRRWLRRVFGLGGERLERAVKYCDVGGAPLAGRWVVAPGEALIRRTGGAR